MTFEQQKNTKALSITVAVHLLLLLVFIFARYSMPAQPPPEPWGMEVNLGTSDNALGTDQPELKDDPAAPENTIALHAANIPHKTNLKDIQTTDNANAPAVDIKTEKQPKEKTPTIAHEANHKKVTVKEKPKYIFSGSSGKGGNAAQVNKAGGNEGIGTGDGDMGTIGGIPGAPNYKGTPGNGNMSWSLNRVLVEKPDPKAVYQKGGKVVVNVTVNREGIITHYQIIQAAYPELRTLVEEKIKKVKFNKAPNARPEEFGTITFDFSGTGK
jgi:outer membrane biosynthesis protein TonB